VADLLSYLFIQYRYAPVKDYLLDTSSIWEMNHIDPVYKLFKRVCPSVYHVYFKYIFIHYFRFLLVLPTHYGGSHYHAFANYLRAYV
jgi:hypothetical protein